MSACCLWTLSGSYHSRASSSGGVAPGYFIHSLRGFPRALLTHLKLRSPRANQFAGHAVLWTLSGSYYIHVHLLPGALPPAISSIPFGDQRSYHSRAPFSGGVAPGYFINLLRGFPSAALPTWDSGSPSSIPGVVLRKCPERASGNSRGQRPRKASPPNPSDPERVALSARRNNVCRPCPARASGNSRGQRPRKDSPDRPDPERVARFMTTNNARRIAPCISATRQQPPARTSASCAAPSGFGYNASGPPH